MIKFILAAYSLFKEYMAAFYIVLVFSLLMFAFLRGKMQRYKEFFKPFTSAGASAYEKI